MRLNLQQPRHHLLMLALGLHPGGERHRLPLLVVVSCHPFELGVVPVEDAAFLGPLGRATELKRDLHAQVPELAQFICSHFQFGPCSDELAKFLLLVS